MSNNKLIIAAAGSGKTTFLINEAKKVIDKNVLITTYTESNKKEIKNKYIKSLGYIPNNIHIQNWFSFLLQHGVRPYQGIIDENLFYKKIGFSLTNNRSGIRYKNANNQPVYWSENENILKHYFNKELNIYSDKISKFIFNCNKKMKGEVIQRISRIYSNIFIDEVQDLAGWDLELLKLLFKTKINIILVGDPRQVVYLTHHPQKNPDYKFGNLDKFIEERCKKDICEIDKDYLNSSHRNNTQICEFSSKLFPKQSVPRACECKNCREHNEIDEGIFLVREVDVTEYCKNYSPTILRHEKALFPEWNFGKAKGLSFDRVLIYPTNPIKNWIKNNKTELAFYSRCKFYVAITRAKYSVGIVYNFKKDEEFDGIEKYNP